MRETLRNTRRHAFVPAEVEAAFDSVKWGSTDGKAKESKVLAKYFSPYTNWTWYVVEATREGDDWYCFGLVDGHEKELGYFMLSELEGLNRGGLPLVERDCYFGEHTLGEFM